MEFFGLTLYGPQNYFKDVMREDYKEPMVKTEVAPIIEKVIAKSTCPKECDRPDHNIIRIIDCYMGRVNGFAYGSIQRFIKMKRKGVIKPVGPVDQYRLPPATSNEYGWFLCDTALEGKDWYVTSPRHPQPSSPNTLILDKVKKNNKYATLF
ncbi:uncharacterized protein LOC113232827 [Hyposmocoma kahamanoa]|uniref:uncharacterized protein LOC113232827 n=1 Tax=Hyposmocoma kahamanoa TaxID=1477025 RepID=UPI000E6D9D77|nr:uncharacterized protein LOC113232827 [Hyposmocoma kahamanoa]